MSSIALVDCNNFFVSCERLFNGKLHGVPVVVLSNNDGCIIARSQEAKALGIPMGAPLFEWRDLIERKKVYITSSNFPLYADLSHRVMAILTDFTPNLEIYSIDEAFLYFQTDAEKYAREVRQRVGKWVGIPLSIGVGPTKTLAKLAAYYAKQTPELEGVFAPDLETFRDLLNTFPVEEAWGIGRRLALRLAKEGVHTCAQLCTKPDQWIRKHMSVSGLRTVWELRGVPAIELEQGSGRKQSIISTRSFGHPVKELSQLEESIALHCARSMEKMRRQASQARYFQVYLSSKARGLQTAFSCFPQATDYTPHLIRAAKGILKKIYDPNLTYKKSGVLLGGLCIKESFQPDLFSAPLPQKHSRFQETIDTLNKKYGKDAAFFAAQGTKREWLTRRNFCSPCYTTRWDELLTIDI